MFAADAALHFPADNSWSTQFRPVTIGRDAFATHRGRAEIEAFLRRYVSTGMQMEVDDILVNGPPWRARAAARVHHWIPGPDGTDAYNNRAILFVETRWGRIHDQEDYEDTVRVAAYDPTLTARA
jgi:ketosteroid isomerase-like protein